MFYVSIYVLDSVTTDNYHCANKVLPTIDTLLIVRILLECKLLLIKTLIILIMNVMQDFNSRQAHHYNYIDKNSVGNNSIITLHCIRRRNSVCSHYNVIIQ